MKTFAKDLGRFLAVTGFAGAVFAGVMLKKSAEAHANLSTPLWLREVSFLATMIWVALALLWIFIKADQYDHSS